MNEEVNLEVNEEMQVEFPQQEQNDPNIKNFFGTRIFGHKSNK